MNENEIKAYKAVSAPPSIKKRILEEEEKGVRVYKRLARLCYSAAAVCAVIAFSFFFLPPKTSLYYGESEIKSSAVVIERPMVRAMSLVDTTAIPLLLETKKPAEVSVSSGAILMDGEEVGDSVKIKKDTELVWVVETDDATLTVKAGSARRLYKLSVKEGSDELLIEKIK